jgi:integrase
MATFRNRHGKWQARIAKKGHAPISKSFITRKDAERWAKQVEVDMQKGSYTNLVLAERTTLGELIDRYIAEVLPSMRGALEDRFRLKALQRRTLSKLSMTALTPAKIADYRDQRLTQVSSGTVIRELAYVSSIINQARREWGINIDNPVRLVRKPQSPQGRNRILNEAEKLRILDELVPRPTRRVSMWMKPLVEFALETGMRRGEMLALTWANVDLINRTAYLPLTKNGESRTVPLSSKAIQILQSLPSSIKGQVFPIKPEAVAAAFIKATRRAGVKDFHFHDLRHTAITHLATKLPNLIELAAVSGHKSLAMLKRYYHPTAKDLALKLG